MITVLTIAISTSIVNTCGPMTPSSKPTLMMTSSISARVFIMMPTMRALTASRPAQRAASVQAPNLPAVASTISSAHQPIDCALPSEPMSVRRPVSVKKIGRKNTLTKPPTR